MPDIEIIQGEGAFAASARLAINRNFATVSILHYATVTLTNAQIKVLPTSANWPTLVAAPGVNKVLMFVSAAMFSHYETGYTNRSDDFPASIITVSYAGDTQVASTAMDNSLFSGFENVVQFSPQAVIVDTTVLGFRSDIDNVKNLALVLAVYNTAGNYTLGDSRNTLTITVAYFIFNTATGLFE